MRIIDLRKAFFIYPLLEYIRHLHGWCAQTTEIGKDWYILVTSPIEL